MDKPVGAAFVVVVVVVVAVVVACEVAVAVGHTAAHTAVGRRDRPVETGGFVPVADKTEWCSWRSLAATKSAAVG